MEKSNEMLMKPFSRVLAELDNPYVRDQREKGRTVIGFFCSYIPMELIAAAGAVPFRLQGSPGRDIGIGTTYLSSRLCTFSRNALTLVLENDYSFLNGFVGCNTCDHIRRASQNWIVKKPANFTHFINRNDVRMIELARNDGLVVEHRDELVVLRHRWQDPLDRHKPPGLPMNRAKYFGHTTNVDAFQ